MLGRSPPARWTGHTTSSSFACNGSSTSNSSQVFPASKFAKTHNVEQRHARTKSDTRAKQLHLDKVCVVGSRGLSQSIAIRIAMLLCLTAATSRVCPSRQIEGYIQDYHASADDRASQVRFVVLDRFGRPLGSKQVMETTRHLHQTGQVSLCATKPRFEAIMGPGC